ncbi:hypothetical protein EMIHUDRAFT_241688 [Emiliania huxleyi CCMP1516]|uniref:Uncharacterized protein n=2 Tax=Emiliania huxleyi TaxID=2903 RepID=A0A0D3JBJ0_EMIH1|nr:hypothetical protein EMIHUDRAFT_220661 [Emiliania huxleyi CCMP1516]XP_005773304.1 hypothetical protein EMIHUDRAFT_241688 [Emiliania huxleyi CCMP1516]EOD04867.1 hypothetical protein EMIHUDRAFT_220661 [Emiliania huxleyi CCMP1516]EOD20875.1 hypothetical protein EMIHUDRAFT_241688 [Emiliania huxleyi CCMP1516]|eukprot:XP_005757296.1 hypothetical protein EMIHUDRAFT_220661 [Emiliania huxleyi CCMP1516]
MPALLRRAESTTCVLALRSPNKRGFGALDDMRKPPTLRRVASLDAFERHVIIRLSRTPEGSPSPYPPSAPSLRAQTMTTMPPPMSLPPPLACPLPTAPRLSPTLNTRLPASLALPPPMLRDRQPLVPLAVL